jgi:hypothetical protein
MNVVCICSTKNEGDIIEAFVRLNGKICNSFFFVDDSTDNTREIIKLLVKEGYDLNYLPKSKGGYNQPNPTRAYLSFVRRTVNPDWIFLLDADEIIVADEEQTLFQEMQDLPPNTYLAAEWRTYIPTTLAYFDSASPLSECFGRRKNEREIYRKISIPGRIADNVMTTPGNHSVRSLGGAAIREQVATSYYLAHFPVRSTEQIIVKNLIATHNLTTRLDAEDGEGFHVFPILQMIRDRNYSLTLEDLGCIALNYACSDREATPYIQDELDLRENPKFKTELSYLDLGRINVIARLDCEIERLSMKIRRMQRGVSLDARYLQVHHDR